MAKKNKSKRKKNKKYELSPEQRYSQGIALLREEHYEAGILLLEKALATHGFSDEAKITPLVEAYDASMSKQIQLSHFKKALSLLTKRLKVSKVSLNLWLCLDIYLKAKQYKSALTFYLEHHQQLAKPNVKEKQVLSLLTPYLLAYFKQLPSDFQQTPLYTESEAAYELLALIFQGELSTEANLKRLSLVGPYKDLRLVARGIQACQAEDRDSTLLATVKKDSSWFELATVMRAAYENSPYLAFSLLSQTSKTGWRLFRKLKGLDEKTHQALIKTLENANQTLNPSDALQFLGKQAALFGGYRADLAKSQLWGVKQPKRAYQKYFDSLTAIEANRYEALWHEEDHGGCPDAKYLWIKLASSYSKTKKGQEKASLIYQRLAKRYSGGDEEVALNFYERALKYNPNAKSTHYDWIKTLLETHAPQATLKKALKNATKRFPHELKFKELSLRQSAQQSNIEKTLTLALTILADHPASQTCRLLLNKKSLRLLIDWAQRGEEQKIQALHQKLERYFEPSTKRYFESYRTMQTLKKHQGTVKILPQTLKGLEPQLTTLAFCLEGLLLGQTLTQQNKKLPPLKPLLARSLETFTPLSTVLRDFNEVIVISGQADITPLIKEAIKCNQETFQARLTFGLLLNELNLKKALRGFSKQFDEASLEGQAAILYFDTLAKNLPRSQTKLMELMHQLQSMAERLESKHPLLEPIGRLVTRILQKAGPRGFGFPRELINLLEELEFS